jgi:uncharacterized damage-inducible protein DinB
MQGLLNVDQAVLVVQTQHAAELFIGEAARRFFGSLSEAELKRPLPDGPVMGGMPVWQIAGAIVEHTAHHRGALTVYSRLLGKVPAMPYGE